MTDTSCDNLIPGIKIDGKEYPFERYIVIFLDLLGQNDKLLDLQTNFKEPYLYDQNPPFGKLALPEQTCLDFEGCFKPVLMFRDSFFNYLEKCKKKITKKHSHIKLLKIPVNFESSSDNIWIWAPLKNNSEISEILTINTILTSLSISYITSIADKVSFRGGVTISYGFEMPNYNSKDKNYYGPGLARAAELEKKASFPRIILDDNVYKLITLHKENGKKSTDPAFRSSGEMAEYCLKYIEKYTAIHASKEAKKQKAEYSLIPPLMQQLDNDWNKAIKFAKSEEKNNISNEKIANKYCNLYSFLTLFYNKKRKECWSDDQHSRE